MIHYLDKLWNKLMLKIKKVNYQPDILITGRIFIHGVKNGITMGNHVTIHSSENVNPTSGISHSHLRTEGNGKIVIGNNVGMSHVNITAFEGVYIEDNVLLGSGVKIWDSDFHSIYYNQRVENNGIKCAAITIKEGAFIGACSIILKGVTIGRHSVVGAGSVVTNNIPEEEVWAGNPAVFIKKLETSL